MAFTSVIQFGFWKEIGRQEMLIGMFYYKVCIKMLLVVLNEGKRVKGKMINRLFVKN